MARAQQHAAGASSSSVPQDRATILNERRDGANMEPPSGDVTLLLQAWARGDRSVEARLFELVVPDLHRMAECLMRKERPDHSIQPTALLDEAYCRLVKARKRDWENRQHFFRVAGRIMRHFLIDYARQRPKGECVPIDRIEQWLCAGDDLLEQATMIDTLLSRLESAHPDWCTIVELKFFAGFSDKETAEALGLPVRTMQRKFGDARRWLFENLENRVCEASRNATNS
jgi:RNA polymerase sigma-70 factor, ECF subfamily